jgi:hypothetical protein
MIKTIVLCDRKSAGVMEGFKAVIPEGPAILSYVDLGMSKKCDVSEISLWPTLSL